MDQPNTSIHRTAPPAAGDLQSMPLFANTARAGLSPTSLPPAYRPHVHILVLRLPERARTAVQRLSINTVGQLLLTTADRLMAIPLCDPQCLEEIRTGLWQWLRGEAPPIFAPVAVSRDEKSAASAHKSVMPVRTQQTNPTPQAALNPLAKSGYDLRALPLFSDRMEEGLSARDLPPTYQHDVPLAALTLSVRSKNVLRTMVITQVGQLLLTPASQLLAQRNFGVKCLTEVRSAVRNYIIERQDIPSASHPGELAKEDSPADLKAYPLYSGRTAGGLAPEDLPASCRPEAAIGELLFSGRPRNVLRKMRIETLGQLLLTPAGQVLQTECCGQLSLREIQQTVRTYILHEQAGPVEAVADDSSFFALVRSSLVAVLRNSQRARIAMMRLGWSCEEIPSLRALAAKFGLTAEGVRGIERQAREALTHPAIVRQQRRFWDGAARVLGRLGGAASLDEFAFAIKVELGWSLSPPRTMLGGFLALQSQYRVDHANRSVLATSFPCLSCAAAARGVGEIVRKRGQIGFPELRQVVHEQCLGSCPKGCEPRPMHSLDYFAQVVDTHPRLAASIHWNGEIFVDREDLLLREGRQGGVLEWLLKQAGGPLHYTEIARQFRQLRGDEAIADQRVHATLARHPSILIWGRGVFIHQDHVQPPLALLRTIALSSRGRLEAGSPFIAIHGVFEDFHKDCLAHAIPTHQALYACLHRWSPLDMQFPHHPYIYGPDQMMGRMTIVQLIEQFIRDATVGVSATEINRYARERVGWPNAAAYSLLGRVPNILKTPQGKYIHVSPDARTQGARRRGMRGFHRQ